MSGTGGARPMGAGITTGLGTMSGPRGTAIWSRAPVSAVEQATLNSSTPRLVMGRRRIRVPIHPGTTAPLKEAKPPECLGA